MKKLLTLIGAAVALNCLVPVDAVAAYRVVRRVVDRCKYCNQPVLAQRYVAGYTKHGEPIFRWRTLTHQHPYYSRSYVTDRDWSYREPDIYARDRYDARWRERRYLSSPEYLRFPPLSIRLDER
jgi:hypothetical protein